MIENLEEIEKSQEKSSRMFKIITLSLGMIFVTLIGIIFYTQIIEYEKEKLQNRKLLTFGPLRVVSTTFSTTSFAKTDVGTFLKKFVCQNSKKI